MKHFMVFTLVATSLVSHAFGQDQLNPNLNSVETTWFLAEHGRYLSGSRGQDVARVNSVIQKYNQGGEAALNSYFAAAVNRLERDFASKNVKIEYGDKGFTNYDKFVYLSQVARNANLKKANTDVTVQLRMSAEHLANRQKLFPGLRSEPTALAQLDRDVEFQKLKETLKLDAENQMGLDVNYADDRESVEVFGRGVGTLINIIDEEGKTYLTLKPWQIVTEKPLKSNTNENASDRLVIRYELKNNAQISALKKIIGAGLINKPVVIGAIVKPEDGPRHIIVPEYGPHSLRIKIDAAPRSAADLSEADLSAKSSSDIAVVTKQNQVIEAAQWSRIENSVIGNAKIFSISKPELLNNELIEKIKQSSAKGDASDLFKNLGAPEQLCSL